MINLYLLLALIGLYWALHRFTDLETLYKISTVTVLALLIIAAYLFESHNSKAEERDLSLSFHFDHNGTLVCQGKEISKKLYNYSVGGHSFLGKKGTTVFGAIIPMDSCEIKK